MALNHDAKPCACDTSLYRSVAGTGISENKDIRNEKVITHLDLELIERSDTRVQQLLQILVKVFKNQRQFSVRV